MRRLTLFLYLLLAFYANAAVNVRFTFSDFTTNPASVKQVVMTPLYQYGVSGTNVLITDKIATKTDKSGVCIVSNVTVGYAYRVELFSVTTTTYTNSFPTNLENGITVESIAYISASTNLGPSSLAYSQAAAESRFATIDMVSGGGINNVTATNISKNVAQSATNDYNSTILARRYIQQGTTNIQFQNESTNVPSQSEGLVYYDNATHTLAYYNDQSAVTVNIGQEEHVRVVNKTSGTISNGQPVTIFGFQGNRPKAILAYSTKIDLPYWSCIGLATHDIAVNAEGLVTAYGVVNGIDTRAYGSNIIYLSTNAGTLTTNLPPSGYNVVKVGIALNNTVNGSIWVSAVQPVHQDDVTGLTNRLAQIEGNTNFSSLYVTNDSEFNSKITVNDLAASEIHSSARPSTSVLALIETDGLITDSAIATTNIATLDDVRAATNGISASSVNDTNVIFADVTGGNATTSKHGYLQKLNGSTSQYLRGDGTWGVPTGLVVPDGNPFHTVNGEGVWESVSEGYFSFSDVTTANATTTKHGLLPKFPASSSLYLDGNGNWTTPSSGVSLTQVSNTVIGMGAITNNNVGPVALNSNVTIGGSVAIPRSISGGSVSAVVASMAFGESDGASSSILASGYGSLAFGGVSSSGDITADSNRGTMAKGYSSGLNSRIYALGNGATAMGDAESGGVLSAVGAGSFVGGRAIGTDNMAGIDGEFLWVGPVMSITNSGSKTAITPTAITVNSSPVITNAPSVPTFTASTNWLYSNSIVRVGTNGTLFSPGVTSLVFQATSSTTVTGGVSIGIATIGIPTASGVGASITNPASQQQFHVVIGDSISCNNSGSGNEGLVGFKSWPIRLTEDTNYSPFITEYNYAQGQQTVSNYFKYREQMFGNLKYFASTNGVFEVMMGYNDGLYAIQWMTNLLYYFKTNMPQFQVWLHSIPNSGASPNAANLTNYNNYWPTNTSYYTKYIDHRGTPITYSDGIHPDEDGHYVIYTNYIAKTSTNIPKVYVGGLSVPYLRVTKPSTTSGMYSNEPAYLAVDGRVQIGDIVTTGIESSLGTNCLQIHDAMEYNVRYIMAEFYNPSGGVTCLRVGNGVGFFEFGTLSTGEALISSDPDMGGSIQVSGGDRIIDWKLGGIRNMHIGSGSTVTIETNTTFLDWEGTIGGPYVALTTNIDTSVSQTLEFVNGMLVTPY